MEDLVDLVSGMYKDQWEYVLGSFTGNGKYRLQPWAKQRFEVDEEEWTDPSLWPLDRQILHAKQFWKACMRQEDLVYSRDAQTVVRGRGGMKVARKPFGTPGSKKRVAGDRVTNFPKRRKVMTTGEEFTFIEEGIEPNPDDETDPFREHLLEAFIDLNDGIDSPKRKGTHSEPDVFETTKCVDGTDKLEESARLEDFYFPPFGTRKRKGNKSKKVPCSPKKQPKTTDKEPSQGQKVS